jgi:hypothetical protein
MNQKDREIVANELVKVAKDLVSARYARCCLQA